MLTVLLRLWLCLHLQPLCALRRAQILLRHPLLPGLLCLTLGCDSSPQSSQALCLDGQQPGESLKSPPGPGKHRVYCESGLPATGPSSWALASFHISEGKGNFLNSPPSVLSDQPQRGAQELGGPPKLEVPSLLITCWGGPSCPRSDLHVLLGSVCRGASAGWKIT